MPLAVTFRGLTPDAEDFEVGTLTWDPGRAEVAADPPDDPFLRDAADSLNAEPHPDAALRRLPLLYKSAYLRAELAGDDAVGGGPDDADPEPDANANHVGPPDPRVLRWTARVLLRVDPGYAWAGTVPAGPTGNYDPNQPRAKDGKFSRNPLSGANANLARTLIARHRESPLSREDARKLVDALAGSTVKELKAIAAEHGGRASGPLKADKVQALSEHLATVYGGPRGAAGRVPRGKAAAETTPPTPPAASAPSGPPAGRPVENHNAPPDHVREVEAALAAVPPTVRDRVEGRYGVRVVAARRVTDFRPDLAGVAPRGWEASGATWDSADGLYDPARKAVVTTSHVLDRAGAERPSGRVRGTALHEYGHAADRAYAADPAAAPASHSPAYLAAYNADAAALPAADRPRYAYFLQRGAAGPEEAFAETFAQLHGGRSHPHADLPAAFPRTAVYIRTLLGG